MNQESLSMNAVSLNKKENAYTVSELTSYIKELLEASFFQIVVEGEISNYKPSSTGHVYFTLKDEKLLFLQLFLKENAQHCLFTKRRKQGALKGLAFCLRPSRKLSNHR